MTDRTRAQTFADALQEFEKDGESTTLLDQYAQGAELVRPEADRADSENDAAKFWDAYRAQFDSIETTFSSVLEEGSLGVLEWSSTGSLTAGRDITYRGVSVLVFDDSDKVSRFATYYDTAAFLEPQA